MRKNEKLDQVYDVAIIGAGPVGLSMANFLGKKGLQILVIEKEKTTSSYSRAPGIWPPTLEIIEDLGLIGQFKHAGIEISQLQLYNADKNKIMLTVPFKELKGETSQPYLMILPQSQTEKILLSGTSRFENISVLFNTELKALQQNTDGVELTCSSDDHEKIFKAKIAIGADGAKSMVRKSIGAKLQGTTYPMDAVLADIEMKSNGWYHSPRITTKSTLAVGIRMDQNIWRLILPIKKGDDQPLTERIQSAADQLFDQPEYDILWKSNFQLHNRISTHFSKNRVVLIGDAAHLNSPVGGQGMNAGIQDVPLIGNAIIQCLELNKLDLLHSTASERRVEIKKTVNKYTDSVTRWVIIKGQGKLIKPFFYTMNFLMKIKPVRKALMRKITMLN